MDDNNKELNLYYISNQVNTHPYKTSTVQEALTYLESIDIIGVDTETEGLFNHSKKVLMLQIGDMDRQYVVDAMTVDISPFKAILENKKKLKLLANASFDYKFLRMHGIVMENIYDTQIAEMVLTTGLDVKVGLAACAYKYLGITLNKDIRTQFTSNFKGFTSAQIEYGARDILYLFAIREKQLEKIKYFNLNNTLSLENLFIPVIADIEYNGFYLDSNMWLDIYVDNKSKIIEAVNKLDQYVLDNEHKEFIDYQLDMFSTGHRCKINWGSSKQVIPYLRFLGVDTLVVEKGKEKHTCEEKHISKYKNSIPFIKDYLEYKKIGKEISTYGVDFLKNINKTTGRVHSNYWQIVSTGRISSNNPNLQNIPAGVNFRSCFKGQGDNTLIVADYSGQEQKVLADQCKDPALLDFHKNGDGDMHCLIARKVFSYLENVDTPTLKIKYKKERDFAKTIGFALNYGGSEFTIADRLQIPIPEAKAMVKAYFDGFPVMTQYFKRKTKETFKNGFVSIDTETNRKSFLGFFNEFKEIEAMVKVDGFWDKYRADKETYKEIVRKYFVYKGSMERVSQNYPTQGLSGSMTKYAGILIRRALIDQGLSNEVLIVNLVHDECVIESPKHLAERAAKIVSDSMVTAGAKFCKTVEMKADAVITPFWEH